MTKKHSGYKGVCELRNNWQASIWFQSKQHYLGIFETMEEAVEIRKLAEKHKKQGDLPEWLSNYRREQQALYNMNSLNGSVPSRTSKSGQKGIYLNKRKRWFPVISFDKKKYYLGSFKSVDEAAAVRNLAADHIQHGDFLEWLDKYKHEKHALERKNKVISERSSRNSKSGYAGVRAVKSKWQAHIFFQSKQHCLGTYETIEEAVAARRLAADHVQRGDFLEWFDGYRRERQAIAIKNSSKLPIVSKSGHKGIYANGVTWSATIRFDKKRYYIGSYNTVEEAVTIQKEAADHILQGDFLDWMSKIKKEKSKI